MQTICLFLNYVFLNTKSQSFTKCVFNRFLLKSNKNKIMINLSRFGGTQTLKSFKKHLNLKKTNSRIDRKIVEILQLNDDFESRGKLNFFPRKL